MKEKVASQYQLTIIGKLSFILFVSPLSMERKRFYGKELYGFQGTVFRTT